MSDIPIPLINYVRLIKNRKSPYYEIGTFLMKEMEEYYQNFGINSDRVYTINPRIVQQKIQENVKCEKLTTVNICRTILALFYGAKLDGKKDFFVTTTSSGRRNYHIKINSRTISRIASVL
ncbi:MAG: hypothetical protein QW840_04750 [Candidatus Bathyarchaeia archaeon]